MPRYHFSLRKHDGSTLTERSLARADVTAAWSTVGEMARQANEKDAGRIVVTDDCGEVIILVGVSSARTLAERMAASLRQ